MDGERMDTSYLATVWYYYVTEAFDRTLPGEESRRWGCWIVRDSHQKDSGQFAKLALRCMAPYDIAHNSGVEDFKWDRLQQEYRLMDPTLRMILETKLAEAQGTLKVRPRLRLMGAQ